MRSQHKECLRCFEYVRLTNHDIAFLPRSDTPSNYESFNGVIPMHLCEICNMDVHEFVWY
jgi:hypothetical protein